MSTAKIQNPEHIYNLDAWFAGAGLGDAFALDGVTSTRVGISAMYAHYDAGGTVCINVSESSTVARFLKELRCDLVNGGSSNSFAKLYASGSDGSGFPLHWDEHPVFVVQLLGEKEWHYAELPSVLNPPSSGGLGADGQPVFAKEGEFGYPRGLRGGLLETPAENSLLRTTLRPRDCLYLPPGTWHRAAAIGHSIAISLSP